MENKQRNSSNQALIGKRLVSASSAAAASKKEQQAQPESSRNKLRERRQQIIEQYNQHVAVLQQEQLALSQSGKYSPNRSKLMNNKGESKPTTSNGRVLSAHVSNRSRRNQNRPSFRQSDGNFNTTIQTGGHQQQILNHKDSLYQFSTLQGADGITASHTRLPSSYNLNPSVPGSPMSSHKRIPSAFNPQGRGIKPKNTQLNLSELEDISSGSQLNGFINKKNSIPEFSPVSVIKDAHAAGGNRYASKKPSDQQVSIFKIVEKGTRARVTRQRGVMSTQGSPLNIGSQKSLQNMTTQSYDAARKKRSISRLTHQKNMETATALNKYEEIQTESLKLHGISLKSKQANCSEMLQQANKDLKTLNYRLSRLVSTGNIHQQLVMGQTKEIEVIAEQMIYCKVSIKDVKDHIVFKFLRKGDNTGTSRKSKGQSQQRIAMVNGVPVKDELRILLSWNHREPTESHNERLLINKRKFMLDPKEMHPHVDHKTGQIVTKDVIYIGFFNPLGCVVTVTVLTAREADQLAKGPSSTADQQKKEVKPDILAIEKSLQSMLEQYEAMQPLPRHNFVQINKEAQNVYPAIRHEKLRIQSEQLPQRLSQVFSRRDQIREDDLKRNYFYLHKWSIIKTKKNEMVEEQMELLAERRKAKMHVSMIVLYKLMKELMLKFCKRKKLIEEALFRVRSAVRMQRNIRKMLRQQGSNIHYRTVKKVKFAITASVTTMVEGAVETKAKPLFLEFLKRTQEIDDMKRLFFSYYRKIVKIQTSNMARISSYKARIQCLTEYWDSVKSEVTKNLVQNKKIQKKSQKIQIRLMQLSNEVRDKFFYTYFNYCKQIYLIKFLFWRLQKLQLNGKPIDYEWLQEIPKLYKQIQKLERFLFENLEQLAEECIIHENQSLNQPAKTTQTMKIVRQIVKQTEDALKMYPTPILSATSDGSPKDPGQCPVFLFLPTKLQIVKMIIKATQEQIKAQPRQTIKENE